MTKKSMNDLYPPESQKMDFIGHLEELRRRILLCLGVLLLVTVVVFARGRDVISFAQRPLEGLVDQLIFITPTEVFTSYVKVSFLVALIFCFPIFLYEAWAFLAPAVTKEIKRYVVLWILLGLVSFVCGIIFSYSIAIPAALKFLLGFGQGIATPSLTLSKYISFLGAFIFIGGFVFEIPAAIGILTEVGLVKARTLSAKRRYAVLVILILAAIITPTQDIINMLVFALPMLVLYEVGIVISHFIEKRKRR